MLCDDLFEDICDEVIKCDDRAPSVPDVILQVISEILAESSQLQLQQQQQLQQIDELNGDDDDDDEVELAESSATTGVEEDMKRNSEQRTTSTKSAVLNQQNSVSGSSIARVMSNYQPTLLDNDGIEKKIHKFKVNFIQNKIIFFERKILIKKKLTFLTKLINFILLKIFL